MNEVLYRSRWDRVLAGVAGGLAEHFELDPSLVRVAWVVLAFLSGGLAIVLYIVMALVVPDEDVAMRREGFGQGPGMSAGPAPDATAPMGTAPTGPGPVPTGGAPFPTGPGPIPSWAAAPAPITRAEWRAQRRAARRAYRGDAAPVRAGVIVGLFLVIVGGLMLVAEDAPDLDLGRYWPVAIVALGVLVLALGFRRPSSTVGGQP